MLLSMHNAQTLWWKLCFGYPESSTLAMIAWYFKFCLPMEGILQSSSGLVIALKVYSMLFTISQTYTNFLWLLVGIWKQSSYCSERSRSTSEHGYGDGGFYIASLNWMNHNWMNQKEKDLYVVVLGQIGRKVNWIKNSVFIFQVQTCLY